MLNSVGSFSDCTYRPVGREVLHAFTVKVWASRCLYKKMQLEGIIF